MSGMCWCVSCSESVGQSNSTTQRSRMGHGGRLYPPSEVPSVELASDSVTRSPPMTQDELFFPCSAQSESDSP